MNNSKCQKCVFGRIKDNSSPLSVPPLQCRHCSENYDSMFVSIDKENKVKIKEKIEKVIDHIIAIQADSSDVKWECDKALKYCNEIIKLLEKK